MACWQRLRLNREMRSCQDEEHLYLVMDVALGGDLRYRINHTKYKRLSKVEVRNVARLHQSEAKVVGMTKPKLRLFVHADAVLRRVAHSCARIPALAASAAQRYQARQLAPSF